MGRHTTSASRLLAAAASLAFWGFSWRAMGSGTMSKVVGLTSQACMVASRPMRPASEAGIATAAAVARRGATSETRMVRDWFSCRFGLALKCSLIWILRCLRKMRSESFFQLG